LAGNVVMARQIRDAVEYAPREHDKAPRRVKPGAREEAP
jgi:hypothetical protein